MLGRVVALLTIVLAAACGGNRYALPNREDPDVAVTEVALAQIVGAARGGADCDVRLLGTAGEAAFVWANCLGWNGATSGPMRIEDERVIRPGDGSLYSEDIREMFPEGLAQLIFEHPDELRP